MEKKGQTKLDIMDVLRQTGLDLHLFMLWGERDSEKEPYSNQGNVQPAQRQ
ncbi:hypothetical protein QFZ77_001851 [Paenibacillus sp. V4I3]|nr:hypothetical protein [Paenibacillus sp. V4I3]MDQ0890891.1 hypothetical protein [Paenibacillus sp. V4I9]